MQFERDFVAEFARRVMLTFSSRLRAIVLGAVLMIVGLLISLPMVGAITGVPLIIFGALLAIRGLF